MVIEGFRRKLTAILSVDVKGYSRLMGDNDAATVRTITAYRQVVTSPVQDHGGRVVDSPAAISRPSFPVRCGRCRARSRSSRFLLPRP
jgi:hypothetical protein